MRCKRKRIDDYWNVDSNRHLSNSRKGFTKFTSLKEKPPKGYMWSGWRGLTKIQSTTRPGHVWPEVWTKIGKVAQNREKQKWARETKARQWSKKERNLLYRSRRQRVIRNYQKRKKKSGKTFGTSHALQKTTEHHESDCKAEQFIREEFPNHV